MDVRPVLQRALDGRAYVEIRMDYRAMRGFVLAVSDTLVLFHRYSELFPYGYSIVHLHSIAEVDHDDPGLRFFASMLAAEGLVPTPPAFTVPLDSLPRALQALKEQRILVELQREDYDSEHGLEVGRLLNVHEQHTVLQLVSAAGELVRVGFGSPCIGAFGKYSTTAPR